jgi:hypothetical protein
MAQKFLTNIDLNQNQLVNAKFEVLGTDPSSGNFEGRLIYNSTEDTIKVYSGSAWRKMLHAVQSSGTYSTALSVSESNGTISLTLNLADTSNAGLLSSTFWNLLNGATDAATVNTLAKRDGNGNISVATPTADGHAATKGYVDAARSGLDVKQSVRAATTGPITLASALENGDTLDTTVTLATGDRVLVKDQSTASENGIYVVNATGAPTRATDFDSNAEVTPGAFTFVEEGTVNADSGWVLTNNGTVNVGVTGLTFAQFSGAGQITAGAGLTKTGNTIDAVGTSNRITVNADSIDIASTYVGQTSITTLGTVATGTWSATTIAVNKGGTNATTESGARTNLASAASEATGRTTSTPSLARIAKQGCAASSTGVSTTTVTHNFGTTDVKVEIYEVSTGATVVGDVTRSNGNTLSIVLYGTIAANDYTIVVVG